MLKHYRLLSGICIVALGGFLALASAANKTTGQTSPSLPTAHILPNDLPTTASQTETGAFGSKPENTALPPTPLPTERAVSVTAATTPIFTTAASVVVNNPPEQPVPGQLTIQFAPGTSAAAQIAYIEQIGGQVESRIEALDTVVVRVPEVIAAGSLPESPLVIEAEPDYYVKAQQTTSDPYFQQQWALPVIGVPGAWTQIPANPATVAVAVIDSGICASHPDLAGRILPGWDFVENDATPQDAYGHGCGVSGVIAAVTNNHIGMAGVAPNARIMPLRVLDAGGSVTYSNVASALVYASDNGVQIFNLSLGGANPSTTLQNAINYAIARDVLVIAAAGNTGSNVLYPAAYTPVVAIASVDSNLQRSSFSAYGPEIDLLEPGRDILTTGIDGGYRNMTGTSLAAPQVAGLAALEMAVGRTLAQTGGLAYFGGSPPAPSTATPTATPEIPDYLRNFKPPVPSDLWLVVLQPNSDPNSVAADLGYENLGQIGTLDDTYLFRAPNSSSSFQAMQDTASALEASPDITLFEQQIARQKVPHTPEDAPRYNEQWHLGSAFMGVNAPGSWAQSYTGSGVQIAIVDDGLQYTHPDIAPNYNANGSCDVNNGTVLDGGTGIPSCTEFDPAPIIDSTHNDYHGTSVAGVAAAADNLAGGNPDYCGVGAAYDARLAGIRLISEPSYDYQDYLALTYRNDINHIYNNSWGPGLVQTIPGAPGYLGELALRQGASEGRDGLGSIFVFSAGNNRTLGANINSNGFANSRFVIPVGAISFGGGFAPYSDYGAPLLISAPGGDMPGAGITTTDLLGSQGAHINPSPTGCTSNFTGTSAAAPLVSGIIALMLDANPNLTWRDVQHILVNTASRNGIQPSGWTKNAAGYFHSYDYGFGRANALAAVEAAETWQYVPEEINTQTIAIPVNQPIPETTTGDGITSTVLIPANMTIEHVEVIFNMEALTGGRGDLEVTLISPAGTPSLLMTKRPKDNNIEYNKLNQLGISYPPALWGYNNWSFTTVRNWGENAAGYWTLKVVDRTPNGQRGTFKDWKLIVYGTEGPPLPPQPTTPADGATINSTLPWNEMVLSWDNTLVYGAEALELQLDTVSPPVNTITLTGGPLPTSHSELLPLGTYYWRVRSVNTDTVEGDPSYATDWEDVPVRTFTIGTPSNAAPIRNYEDGGTITLRWSHVSFAAGYQIEVSSSATFSGTPLRTTLVESQTTWTVDPPLVAGLYYWRVRGCQTLTDGVCDKPGGWSVAEPLLVGLP